MFEQKPLSYPYDALMPYIDAQTMEIHYSKHHATYVTNLNKALEENAPELFNKTVEEILMDLNSVPETARTAVKNNAGGHANHTMFWELMAPNTQSEPTGEILDMINKTFENFASFKELFGKAATTRFGSGWAWLVLSDKGLEIMSTANQDSPISENKAPVLALDVWEHAYYLKYQNKRAEYIENWWNVVNWNQVSANLEKARAFIPS